MLFASKIKWNKIAVRLTLFYAFVFSLVLISLNAFVLLGVKQFMVYQNDLELQELAGRMEKNLQHGRPVLLGLDLSNGYAMFFKDSQGKIVYAIDGLPVKIPRKPIYDQAIEVEIEEIHYVYRQQRLNIQQEVFDLSLIKEVERDQKFLECTFFLMAISDCLGVLASLLAGFLMSKKMLAPIDRITKAAQKISVEDLSQRIEGNGSDDELNRLIQVFNAMIERLQRSFEMKNRFVSDASHELRTPISVIKGYSNLLARWGKEDKQVLDEAIEAIQQEVQGMILLIEKLLYLARNDVGSQKAEKEIFYLDDLLKEVLKESEIVAPDRQFVLLRNDMTLICADPRMIKQMFRAILDNSIKFTGEQGMICLQSVLQKKTVQITITDDGIGIPEEDLSKIFSRFYRADPARSKETGGSGLGLSIVQLIVAAHQGKIEAESIWQQGTKMIITLPRL